MVETALALCLEAALGYPQPLQRCIGHPVQWIAALIDWLEQRLNRPETPEATKRNNGIATALIIAGCGAGFGWSLQALCGRSRFSPLLIALAATPGLAQRSLYEHVDAVRRPLQAGDLKAAKTAVGRIVGREVETLDEAGVAKAALESLSESFNDGVVAPAFWLAVGGLPGLYAYKALNTADSLIGHKEPRWRAFGWASARADDLVNLIPARLAGGLIALAGGQGWRTMIQDAPKHSSPNAGWPEAAMAGALDVELGGPVVYDGALSDRSALGAGSPMPTVQDVSRGLTVYRNACLILSAGAVLYTLARRCTR